MNKDFDLILIRSKLSSKPSLWYQIEIHCAKVRLCISAFKKGSVTPKKLLGATLSGSVVKDVYK